MIRKSIESTIQSFRLTTRYLIVKFFPVNKKVLVSKKGDQTMGNAKNTPGEHSTMPQESRVIEILRDLKRTGSVRVTKLATKLGVSEVTIRNDLTLISEATGLLKFHGGAERNTEQKSHYYGGLYGARTQHNAQAKDMIGDYAVQRFTADADSLLLDAGSAVEAFVKRLVGMRTGIRAISSAANTAMHFVACNDSVYVQLGGVLHSRALLFADNKEAFDTNHFFRDHADQFLSNYSKTGRYKAFLSITGFDEGTGDHPSFTVNSQSALESKQRMINAASCVYFLVDHSKFSVVARSRVTYFGFSSDDWLKQHKDAYLIVDWPANGVPDELKKLTRKLDEVKYQDELQAEFPLIRVFKTKLRPRTTKADVSSHDNGHR